MIIIFLRLFGILSNFHFATSETARLLVKNGKYKFPKELEKRKTFQENLKTAWNYSLVPSFSLA